MASVALSFTAPLDPELITLKIYESASQGGPFTLIETVDEIGGYPNYIDNYTTDEATSATNWFSIQWVDANGAHSELSEAIKGGTETVLGNVIDRVMLYDPSIDNAVAAVESEAVVESYFHKDPYTVTDADLGTKKYTITNGLAHLALSRVLIVRLIKSNDITSVTLGLVTMRSGAAQLSTSEKQIQGLLDLANKELGIATSLVLQLTELCNTYGQARRGLIPYVIQ